MAKAKFSSTDIMLTSHGYGLLNPLATDDKLYKAYIKAIAAIKDSPISYADFKNLFEPQIGYRYTVPLQTLLLSWENEEFSQYNIVVKNVLDLLISLTDGLLTGNKLSRHIEAAYKPENIRDDGSVIDPFGVIIGGGRHRLVAIIFILVVSQIVLRGFDPISFLEGKDKSIDEFAQIAQEIMEEDDFLELEIPVQPVLYSLAYIRRSNKSRRMDASENNFISLQSEGIDVNLVDVAKAIIAKQITPSKGWSAMFALLADRQDVGLTVLSAHQLGSKVFTFLKNQKFAFPTKVENLVTLVQAIWERVPIEVQHQLKNGVTNMARFGVPAMTSNLGAFAVNNVRTIYSLESEVSADVKLKTKPTTVKKRKTSKKTPVTDPQCEVELVSAG